MRIVIKKMSDSKIIQKHHIRNSDWAGSLDWHRNNENNSIYADAVAPFEKRIGKKIVLGLTANVGTGKNRGVEYYWPEDNLEGIQGNSDRNIRRTIGWRGTTDDRSIYALGIFEVKKIIDRKLSWVIVMHKQRDH